MREIKPGATRRFFEPFKNMHVAYGLACAAFLTLAVPASAQIVVRDGHRGDGVSVRIGDNNRHHHRHRNNWRNSRADCKVIKTRTHRPNGTVVVKTRRVCN
jgi:hypothetical protein